MTSAAQNKDRYLYEDLDVLRKSGNILKVPEYIENSLSSKIKLREYQKEALENFITYYEGTLRKNKQIHLLFHMATGSGKTVEMASLILYLYQKGYRKFLFFVDSDNIVEKTIDNFLNPASNKHLFNENIEIDGNLVSINRVNNFSAVDLDAINICFNTIQGLHGEINEPKEGKLTIEDFEDDKIVLIADEAHHLNSLTKRKLSIDEQEVKMNWETTVQRLFISNRDNILLEFTATSDNNNRSIIEKYLDKIIYNYPLSVFRASGYTKDFENMQSDYEIWERTLLALVISEYRMSLFGDIGQNVKPVVLLKSQKIADSKRFYEQFFQKLSILNESDIQQLEVAEAPFIKSALSYFKSKDDSYRFLIQSLKLSFDREKSIIMNQKTDNTVKKQLAVNSLEDPDNNFRIIFTVEMLNEGWDVLNLYDIVRLYETRQSSGKTIAPFTIREAQLIGRGARYYPFITEEGQELGKRKFDSDLENEYRILETLLYHSKQDSRYIAELRLALIHTGLIEDEVEPVDYVLKETFKDTEFYKTGIVFSNKRMKKSRREVESLEGKIRNKEVRFKVSKGEVSTFNLFEEGKRIQDQRPPRKIERFKVKDIPLNISSSAMDSFDVLKFNYLKSRFPNLASSKEFLTSESYLGNIEIIIDGVDGKATPQDIYEAMKKALKEVAIYISGIKEEYEGTKIFHPVSISKVVKDKKVRVEKAKGDGRGVPQSAVSEELAIDLNQKDWFVFTEHYGTDQEKMFVRYLSERIEELQTKYEYKEIYLIRNERIADLALYSFENGERFEPDFLLFLRKNNSQVFDQEQYFVEPKGKQLLESDKWKEDFLLQIKKEGSIVNSIYTGTNKLYGLPFFNEPLKKAEFDEEFYEIIEKNSERT